MRLTKDKAEVLNMRAKRLSREVTDRVAIELVLTFHHKIEYQATIPELGGHADIIDHTAKEVIEVTGYSSYEKAIPKVLGYAGFLKYQPVIYLFTKDARNVAQNKKKQEEVTDYCKEYGIAVRFD